MPPAPSRGMSPTEAAERLRLAEREYRAALLEHDTTDIATERYRAAASALAIAEAVAAALVGASR